MAQLVLTPFLLPEVATALNRQRLWVRGGFPESLLAVDDQDSFDWREDLIRPSLERDVPSLGFNAAAPVMKPIRSGRPEIAPFPHPRSTSLFDRAKKSVGELSSCAFL